jgi:Short C-terminal domain
MADKERPVASFAPSIRSIKLYRGGRIEYQGKSGSVIGATARVDSSGSKGRFRDTRRIVLRIDGPHVAIQARLPANAVQLQREAREFAAAVNETATGVAEPTPRTEPTPHANPTPAPTSPRPLSTIDLLDQLERLGRLRDSGVLTDDEFQEQKARLLRPKPEP